MNTRPTVASNRATIEELSQEINNLALDSDDRYNRMTQRLADLEQLTEHMGGEVQRLCAEKRDKFRWPDFKTQVADIVQRLAMVALILLGAYFFLNSEFMRNVNVNNNQNQQQNQNNNNQDDSRLTLTELSRKYAPFLENPARLANSLDTLVGTIDDSFNPTNELRPLIQFEAPQWREALGSAFQREHQAGRRPSEIIREIVAGLR